MECASMQFGEFPKILILKTILQILIFMAIQTITEHLSTTTVKWDRIFRNICKNWRQSATNMTTSKWCLNSTLTISWVIFIINTAKSWQSIQKPRRFLWNIATTNGTLKILRKKSIITCYHQIQPHHFSASEIMTSRESPPDWAKNAPAPSAS